MRKKILFLLIIFFLLISKISFVTAQKTKIYDEPKAEYRQALELVDKKKFGAAKEIFEKLVNQIYDRSSIFLLNSEYYDAFCAMELNQPEAKTKFKLFIEKYPDFSKINLAYLNLGRIEYTEKKYRKALAAFENVDAYQLSPDDHSEYLYKLGYCNLKTENYDKAKEVFYPILNTNSDYQTPAIYYYAHIAYMNRNYDVALSYFEKIKDEKDYREIIPFYLLQIYFINENYKEIIALAPEMLNAEIKDKKRSAEVARILAEAYYISEKYNESLPYFEKWEKLVRRSLKREEYYKLAYVNYKAGDYEKAIKYFQKSVKGKDALSQNAYYHLGDCYLKTDQKQFAQSAFYSAYQLDFDQSAKEDALFNYAKLSYELAYDPYNQAIEALKQYISDYPGSERIDEAYSYLTNLFLSTRNYQSAIDAIENIRLKNTKLKKAYQKITFFRGLQLFNENKFDAAIENFRKSLINNYVQKITAEAKFWIGESYYRLENYPKAIDFYDDFMVTPGAHSLEIYPMTLYNLGYSYFKLKYYDNAVITFQQFQNRQLSDGDKFRADALLRIGDCYFITKNFQQAIDYYTETIKENSPDKDYAIYQKALSQGAMGEYDGKIQSLKNLIVNYPDSPYNDDACFEIASTYLLLNDGTEALQYYNRLINNHPNSSYKLKSFQKTGLIFYNNNDYDKALQILRKVAGDYQGTKESKEALVTIRNIYMEKNEVDEYFKFVNTISSARITATEQDSIIYLAAENLYMNGETDLAAGAFEDYIGKFPQGAFILSANFYKAECDFNADSLENALKGYEYVIENPKSRFTENSLLRAANISFDLENYDAALRYYSKLEQNADYKSNLIKSLEGQMECSYHLGKFNDAIAAAQKLLKNEKISNDVVLLSHYIMANSALATGNISLAQKEFEKTVELSETEMGAEAKYKLAKIHYDLKNYKKAETGIFELANRYPAYEYWKAKSFILLADIYTINGNIFQAKQTLQSIIDNYEETDLTDIASQKLNKILEKEKAEKEAASDTITQIK